VSSEKTLATSYFEVLLFKNLVRSQIGDIERYHLSK
jgi:hypothetical protein